jgi:hypothetical protein
MQNGHESKRVSYDNQDKAIAQIIDRHKKIDIWLILFGALLAVPAFILVLCITVKTSISKLILDILFNYQIVKILFIVTAIILVPTGLGLIVKGGLDGKERILSDEDKEKLGKEALATYCGGQIEPGNKPRSDEESLG